MNEACTEAARERNLDCLKFLIKNGCKMNSTSMAAAARGGSMECLLYLFKKGCEWNYSTCAAAA